MENKNLRGIGVFYESGDPIMEYDVLRFSSDMYAVLHIMDDIKTPHTTFEGVNEYVILYSNSECAYCLYELYQNKANKINGTYSMSKYSTISSLLYNPITPDHNGVIHITNRRFIKIGTANDEKYKSILKLNK